MSTLQIFEALDAATEAALRASIQTHGVLVPVAVDQNERIIDGHHRARIANELDIPFDTITHWPESDAAARELARTLNEDRRQLPIEQRREVVADLREQGHSERAIAGAVGVGRTTVQRDLARGPGGPPVTPVTPVGNPTPVQAEHLSESGHLPVGTSVPPVVPVTPERVTGTDGKSYPARKPKPEPTPDSEYEDLRRRHTGYFARGIVDVHGTLFGDPASIRRLWMPSANTYSTVAGTGHLGTPAGIREVAQLLLDLADDLDANQPEGLTWA